MYIATTTSALGNQPWIGATKSKGNGLARCLLLHQARLAEAVHDALEIVRILIRQHFAAVF
jgi:hypothetical protein